MTSTQSINQRRRRLIRCGILLLLISVRCELSAQTVNRSDVGPSRVITIAQMGAADVVGTDSAALQRAANLLRVGDALMIGPGTYRMDNSLFVPSGVTVRGTPGLTVLRKSAGVESLLVEDGDYGEIRLAVAEPDKFRPGMGIAVTDDILKSDWDVSVTTVIGVQENVLRINPMTLRDYGAERHHAKVQNTFPILCAIDTENVTIEDIIVDGNKAENAFLDGCRGGAIYLYQSRHTIIRRCTARDYNGDGISFQITENIRVLDCEVYRNTSHGIHPGAGSARSLVQNCRVFDNARVGLFLCWRVSFGVFAGNIIERNGEHGVSIGHKDTDNRFLENTMTRNGIAGVYFRQETFKNSGHRNFFRGNTVTDNGGDGKGYGFYFAPCVEGIELRGNRIADTRSAGERTQRYGVYRANGANPVRLADNQMSGHLADEFTAPFSK
ncbi:MAG: right-handed parallel beta-helix repeat-containing protein [Fimbriimonadaceae bacterium]